MSGEKPKPILLIDDDRKLCRLTQEYLEPFGYKVEAVHTGPDGLRAALEGDWAAVILDVMLPGMDGLEVLRRIRERSDLPVLMLSARGDETDRIVGLELGADDYIPKAFSPRELLARLKAVTRRAARRDRGGEAEDREVVVGPLRIAPASRAARLGERPLSLTPVEFDLLLSLARAKGRVKTRQQLLDEIRNRDYEAFDRSIDVHISSLRKKLGDNAREPRFIRTIRAVGYMMEEPRNG